MSSGFIKSPLPYLALIVAYLIWGANYVIAKITLQEFPVMGLSFIRFALSTILLIPFLVAHSKVLKVEWEDIPKLFLIGLAQVTFSIALFYQGLSLTTSINASVISMISPMLSLLGGWLILRERVYWINLVGVFFGFIGALIILDIPLIFFGNISNNVLLGNFLIFLSAISGVIGGVMSKPMLEKYSSLFVTFSVFLTGALTFALPAYIEYTKNPDWIFKITILGVLGLLFIVVLSSIVAFFLYDWALEKVDIIKANLFHYMEPAVAASLAVPLLGERISYSFIVGTVLVVLGVYWGTLGKPEHHHHRSRRI